MAQQSVKEVREADAVILYVYIWSFVFLCSCNYFFFFVDLVVMQKFQSTAPHLTILVLWVQVPSIDSASQYSDLSACADILSGSAFFTITTHAGDTQMVSSQNANNCKLTLLFRTS